MKIVCLIPARGGSKRLPNKNIKKLNGKPLIAHAIEKTNKVEIIDEVWVSTDDEKIKHISEKYGAKVLMRPLELAQDTSDISDVMIHFAKNIDFEYIVLFECTYPLTTVDDLNNMLLKFFNEEYDSMLLLEKTNYFVWEVNEKKGTAKSVSYDLNNQPRTQNYNGLYTENGGLYITSKKLLLRSKQKISGKIGYYPIDHKCIDIDTEFDFWLAEQILKRNENEIVCS